MGRFNMISRGAAPVAPVNSVAPVVSGSATQGSTLSCTTGTWSGSPTFAYQWKRAGVSIGGATSSTYATVSADLGTSVTCTVTASNLGGSASATSNGITVTSASTLLAPSSNWTGTANSGWGVGTTNGSYAKPTVPADTALVMPSLQPGFLQYHFCTGTDGSDYLVFCSWALGPGLGVQKVRVSTEGNFIDITTRSWLSYTDLRGTSRRIFGYVFQLDYATMQAAHANGQISICAESWANNGAWNRQCVIDYFVNMRPGSALTAGNRYDEVKTFGSGGDYSTCGAAMSYAAAQATANPNKIIGLKPTGTGTYDATVATTQLNTCTHATEIFVDPASGHTATIANYGGTVQLALEGLRFWGKDIKFDVTASGSFSPSFRLDNALTRKLTQFVGCEFYGGNANGAAGTSGSGSSYLVGGEQINQPWIGNVSTVNAWVEWKDVYAHDLPAYGLGFGKTLINCDVSNVSGSGAECIWGLIAGGSQNRIGGYFSGLNVHQHSIDITNTGGGTPTYTKTTTSNGSTAAGNGSFGFLNLYRNGSFVVSFNLSTYTTFSALATAINASTGTSGFTATADGAAILNTSFCSKSGLNPSDALYPAVSFSSNVAAITSLIDIHGDAIVHHGSVSPGDRVFNNFIAQMVTENELSGTAPISTDGTAEMQNCAYVCINGIDTSSANGISAQRGYWQGIGKNHQWASVSVTGSGAGTYISGTSFDANTGITGVYQPTIFWTGSQQANYFFQALRVNINSLPAGATSGNDSYLRSSAESTFIDASTGVPVLNGDLKNLVSYSCALVPTSLIVNTDSGNYGWNIPT